MAIPALAPPLRPPLPLLLLDVEVAPTAPTVTVPPAEETDAIADEIAAD